MVRTSLYWMWSTWDRLFVRLKKVLWSFGWTKKYQKLVCVALLLWFSIPSHEQLWWSLLWQCFAAIAGLRKLLGDANQVLQPLVSGWRVSLHLRACASPASATALRAMTSQHRDITCGFLLSWSKDEPKIRLTQVGMELFLLLIALPGSWCL